MRSSEGGVAHIAKEITRDMANRNTGLIKAHVEGLADCAAVVLTCQSVNTSEWRGILPRTTGDEKSKERYISRLLSHERINPSEVMQGYIPQLARILTQNGATLVLMLDQSIIRNGLECLMVSLRFNNRAIPVAWVVKETKGAIGFETQEELLNIVLNMLPKDIKIMLSADRFYGTAAMVNWCQKAQWDYRIRLKDNNILQHDGGEITTGAAARAGMSSLIGARFNNTSVVTNIGILHEKGHKEPWIIAMSQLPSKSRVLDYGLRWGIECMFSDFKSRGFGITKTHITHPDRLERLILVLAIALLWAVSAGMQPQEVNDTKKNTSAA